MRIPLRTRAASVSSHTVSSALALVVGLTVFAREGNSQDPQRPTHQDPEPTGPVDPDEPQDPDRVRVVVSADAPQDPRSGDYRRDDATSATRSATPIEELPYSVTVLPETLVRDVAAVDLDDVTRFAAGVHYENIGGFLGANDTSFVRGFRTRFLYYDGFLLEAIPSINPSTLDRVEVLKGPNSVLYGTMEPGGMLNIISKGAVAKPFAEFRQRIGGNRFHESTVDVGGAVVGSDTLMVRLNGGFRNNESFRQYFEDDREWINGSVTWRPVDEFELDARIGYSEQERVIDEGVAFSAAGDPVGPIDRFLGEPGFPGQHFRQVLSEVWAKWFLTDELTLRSGFLASNWSNNMRGVRRSAPTQADGTVNRLFEDSDFSQDSYQWTTYATWATANDDFGQQLSVGIDLRRRGSDLDLRRGSYPSTSITNPTYGNPPPTVSTIRAIAQEQDWVSVFVQEQIDLLGDDLHLNVAGRYDRVEQESGTESGNDDAFTLRGGALYDITEDFGVYASAGQSFVPQGPGSVDVNGSRLDPERGIQFEAGIRNTWLDDRVRTSLAVFELTKDEVTIADPNNPGFQINAGELRSRGIELEASGEIVEGLTLIGSYAYLDTEVRRSDSLAVGTRFRNIPAHSGNLWLRYQVQDGPAEGLGFGAGIQAMTDRAGDDQDTFHLPGYWRLDLGLFYTAQVASQPIDLQMNVINALDETYYESSLANSRVFPGAPRTLFFSCGVRF